MKVQNILTLAASVALITSTSATVTMDWVYVNNANNAADTADGDPNTNGIQRFGSVDHNYKIGRHEVTNSQYAAFLNAKGASNSNGIYNEQMNINGNGIIRTGGPGNFAYTAVSAPNNPVVFVSWFDAARFANWMMNGQGNGDMEDGAYALNGATSGIITAKIGAQVYLPSENEWYKAAYYKAVTTSYSLYPNGANTISTVDANYTTPASSPVGYYSGAPSSYGTYDQGGNVWEWNDAVNGSQHGARGGSFGGLLGGFYSQDVMASTNRVNFDSTLESSNVGFRLAGVPEPTSIALSMLAGGMMLIRRKR